YALGMHRTIGALATILVLSSLPALAANQAQKCEKTVATSISACVARVGARMRKCYLSTGSACATSEMRIVKSLGKISTKVTKQCPDTATVQSAGYGAVSTPAGLIARAQEECTGETAALLSRTFGGPQAAVLATADASLTTCLSVASTAGLKLLRAESSARGACIRKAQAGK